MSSAPIDGGWAWMVVFGVFMNAFFMLGITKSVGIFLVEFMDRFQVSTAYASVAFTAGNLLFALGAPITGVLGETITHRKVMIFGGIAGLIGFSLCSLLVNMSYVIVFFALALGIGNSCSYGSGMVMIGKYFRNKRSTATGIALSGSSFGHFAMPPIIEYLLEAYGLGGTLLLVGALYLHCSLAGALLRPIEHYDVENSDKGMLQNRQLAAEEEILDRTGEEQKYDRNSSQMEIFIQDGFQEGEKISCRLKSELPERVDLTKTCNDLKHSACILSKTENKHKIDKDVVKDSKRKQETSTSLLKLINHFSILRNYVVIHFVFVSFCAYFAIITIMALIPAIAVDRGMTQYHKAMLVSLSGIGDLIARISMGYLADKHFVQRYKLKCMTAIVCALNNVVFVFAKSFLWMGVHCFIFGLSAGAYVGLLPVVLLDFLPLEVLSKTLGLTLFALGVGGSIGQIFLGTIRDMTGSYTAVLLIQAVSMVICGILLICTPFVSRLEQRRNKNRYTDIHGTDV